MSDHNNMKPPSLWRAEPDEVKLLALGKLIEELNECGARAARCIIHGIESIDPDTKKVNSFELEKELADVDALFRLVLAKLDLNMDFICERSTVKYEHKRQWLDMVRIIIEAEAK